MGTKNLSALVASEIRELEMFDVCTEGVCLVIPTWLGGSYQVVSSHAKRWNMFYDSQASNKHRLWSDDVDNAADDDDNDDDDDDYDDDDDDDDDVY